jgi:hypothetical protein
MSLLRLILGFDRWLYLREMSQMVDEACAKFRTLPGSPVLYTASIWTDPDAACSAVNIDTWENSQAECAKSNAFNDRHRARYLAEGNKEMAALFGVATRNDNPADFAYRELALCRHRAIIENWEHRTGGRCWRTLEPLLDRVRYMAAERLRLLPLHPDAILATNSHEDWFHHQIALRSPT